MNNLSKLDTLIKCAENSYNKYYDKCTEILEYFRDKFSNIPIHDVIFQQSDQCLVIVWGESENSVININLLKEVEDEEQFLIYLENNSI